MSVHTHLEDHNGLKREHTGNSGITETAESISQGTQVWFEFDFHTRDQAIFLLGGLLIRIAQVSGDPLRINEAVTLYVSKMGDTLPTRLLKGVHHE